MRSMICALSLMTIFTGCNVNSSVSFRDGFRGGNTASEPPAPGLSVSEGGFMRQPTALGNTATLSIGAPVNSVHHVTPQSHTVYLNVSGRVAQ